MACRFDSNMLKEKSDPTLKPGDRYRTDDDGPPLLAADERMVHSGRQGGEVHRHRRRRDPQLRRAGLLDQAGRQPGPAQRDLGQGRPRRASISANAPSCAARATAIMPIAVEVVPPAQFAAMGRVEGRAHAGRQAGRSRRLRRPRPPRQPQPPADRSRASPAARDQPGRDRAELKRRRDRAMSTIRRRPPAQGARGARRAPRRRPQAGLLRPLVHVDQPQGHRHALPDLRDHRGHDRRRASPGSCAGS